MLRDTPCKPERELIVDRVWMESFMTGKGTKVGLYNLDRLFGSEETS